MKPSVTECLNLGQFEKQGFYKPQNVDYHIESKSYSMRREKRRSASSKVEKNLFRWWRFSLAVLGSALPVSLDDEYWVEERAGINHRFALHSAFLHHTLWQYLRVLVGVDARRAPG